MIGRRTAVGLSLLCALLFSALATQSASAEKATNTTAVTCVKDESGPNGEFKDPHCNEKVTPGTGSYIHVKIANDTTTEIEATNTANANFSATVFSVKVGGICKTAKTTGNIHNVESEAKKHTVTGENITTFSNCTVEKPAKCTVKEPMVVEALFEGAEGLGASKNEMGGALTPKNGSTFATIQFEGAECSLKGKSFTVGTNGPTIGTGGALPASPYAGEPNFTGEMTQETLVAGGSSASFSVKTTLRMAAIKGVEQPPISLTTVT